MFAYNNNTVSLVELQFGTTWNDSKESVGSFVYRWLHNQLISMNNVVTVFRPMTLILGVNLLDDIISSVDIAARQGF